MLLFFLLSPHNLATFSLLTKRKTPLSWSSQQMRLGQYLGSLSKSRINSHSLPWPFSGEKLKNTCKSMRHNTWWANLLDLETPVLQEHWSIGFFHEPVCAAKRPFCNSIPSSRSSAGTDGRRWIKGKKAHNTAVVKSQKPQPCKQTVSAVSARTWDFHSRLINGWLSTHYVSPFGHVNRVCIIDCSSQVRGRSSENSKSPWLTQFAATLFRSALSHI